MNKKDIRVFKLLFQELENVSTEEELAGAIEKFISELGDKDTGDLKVELYKLGGRMLSVDAENKNALRTRRIACLTDIEKEELKKVEEIIDGNLLKYYFQPIVSAWDGEIFSYEALMRSAADPSITPYHILKYAGINDRLGDIERATFMNVLEIIEREKDKLGNRAVFINSIPNVTLGSVDSDKISELLKRNSDSAVVELTENAEADEGQLNILKDRYRNMNIRIAVDDYGTGYSNVRNLLRYTPNFVKIDRSLLSEINSDPKKRHFVRDIIEFCHDNNIWALAEGVETSAELKTVILMGVDLIQGFYTAKPSPELITSIPYEIKQEIRLYQTQRMDGKETHVFKVDSSERVLLDKLKKHGYKCIRILPMEEDGDITIVGSSSLDTHIHIEVDSGFKGRITLESAHLSNAKGRPCIQLAEDCVVELSIFGECVLHKGGIYVPESSELTFTGVGALLINVNNSQFYGIGGHYAMRHGKLSFSANVEFILECYGHEGVAIGSGLGGNIDIHQGVFNIKMNTNLGVAIGSMTGYTDLDVRNCAIETNTTFSKGAVIGSRDGDAELILHSMSYKGIVSGKETVCIGSVMGTSKVTVDNSNFVSDARSDCMTILGSLYNDSSVRIHNISMDAAAGGAEAYIFGGIKGNTHFECDNVDIQIKLNTTKDRCTTASGDDLHVGEGRYIVIVNGEEQDIAGGK